MNEGTREREGVRVLSIPPGEVHDLRAALDHGGGIHRSDLWAGFVSSPALPDPQWVEAHADSFDVAHVHLGLGAMSPVALFHLIVRLRARGKPVVLTVHNLEHPCLAQSALDELLQVAVPTADEVVTFTVGAAREILRRWGRVAHILPHPPVIPAGLASGPRPRGHGFAVGVDATRRCGVAEAWETVEATATALAAFDDATLRVEVHPDLMTPGAASYCPALTDRALELAASGELDLRFHGPYGIEELATYLRGLDAFIVPQQRGSHSSWVEACHDVGTMAIVPDHGYVAEQGPCLTYRVSEPASLGLALRAAFAARRSRRPLPEDRAADLELITLAHRELYLSLMEPRQPADPLSRVLQAHDPP